MMKNKFFRQRLKRLSIGFCITLIGVVLLIFSIEKVVVFYYTPGQLSQNPPLQRWIRLGGQVKKISSVSSDGKVYFWIEEKECKILVAYKGALPSLFRLGQGIIAEGKLISPHFFEADILLIKHDENYRPPQEADRSVPRANQ
jgi:cytochrome c-type biogenesis protein CcmE